MKPGVSGIMFVAVFFCFSMLLSPAVYKGEKIDEKHFSAKIRLKDADESNFYRVDVVFVGRKANLVFAANQILPAEAGNSVFMTLYLLEDEIEDPEKILLKQVSPPVEYSDKDPEDWEIMAYWYMKLDLSPLK